MTKQCDSKGKGALWENGKIPLTDKDPVFTGNFTSQDGEVSYIAVWENKQRTHTRQPAYRFTVTAKEEAIARQREKRPAPTFDD